MLLLFPPLSGLTVLLSFPGIFFFLSFSSLIRVPHTLTLSFLGLARESSRQYGIIVDWMPDQVGHDMEKGADMT